MDEEIKITRADLERAIRKWDEKSRAEAWPDRADDGRHADNADYLFGLLKEG